MDTCFSIVKGLNTQYILISSASGLPRTKVQVDLEEKNRNFLKFVNRKVRL